MGLEEGLDTGPVYECETIEIGTEDTAEDLRSRLAQMGTEMLVRALREGLPEPTPQVGEPTYAAKVEANEHELDWTRSAVDLHRRIRLGHAWTTFRGRRLKVSRARLVPEHSDLPAGALDPDALRVGTGEGSLELVEVQPEGKPTQPATAWRNGARLTVGGRFE
jgi:methionyl-tRNA formyltransferase